MAAAVRGAPLREIRVSRPSPLEQATLASWRYGCEEGAFHALCGLAA